MTKALRLVVLMIVLQSCVTYYKIDKGAVDSAPYTLRTAMSAEDALLIDTTRIYKEVTVGDVYDARQADNPRYLKFFGDGTLVSFTKYAFVTHPPVQSKFRFMMEDGLLKVEGFYPSWGGKTRYYVRLISTGKINGDTIMMGTPGKDLANTYHFTYYTKASAEASDHLWGQFKNK